MISNLHRNIMGTTSFDAKFPGMRKAQDFIVYPIKADDSANEAVVQSDTRIGRIDLATGTVRMSRPHANGANFIHLSLESAIVAKLSQEDLFALKAHIMSTAHGDAGRAQNGVIGCDNSGALEVFG